MRRAARLGDAYISTGPIAPLVADLSRRAAPAGQDPDAHEIAAGITWLLVARDPEKRWREAEQHFLYQINLYAQWFGEAGMQIAAVAKSRADLANRGADDRLARAGARRDRRATPPSSRSPASTAGRCRPGLPPEWSDEHLELMAREVMPHFRV